MAFERVRLRDLPALHRLLDSEPVQAMCQHYPAGAVREALREELSRQRARIAAGEPVEPSAVAPQGLAAAAEAALGWLRQPALRRVINATGVVLHTNLGRAPLAARAASAASAAGGSYVDLEFDLESGRRGSRQDHAEPLLCRLTGADAALVVNNNAAAVFLVLRTLSAEREIVISRGELVEIGGSFRIPDVMAESGAILREIGTTNRTHPQDYAGAIGPQTAALMRVHPSNFRQIGFTERVDGATIASLAHEAGVLFFEDLGSGALSPLLDEPTVQEVLASGADLVTLSGDKLVGGPQAGIVLGRADLVAQLRSAPLYRALRPDKMTLAALAETARLYLQADEESIPVLAMLRARPEALRLRAQALRRRLGRLGVPAEVIALEGRAGGGALPESPLHSYGIAMCPQGLDAFHRALRLGTPGVVGRLEEDRLLLDVRTVLPGEERELARAVAAAWDAQPR